MNISIDNIFEKIFDNFKKITPFLIAIAIFTGLLLFLPENTLKTMKLNELPILWYRIIGITFLLSIALITTIVLSSMFSPIKLKWQNWQKIKKLKKEYKKLSPEQKEIILQLLKSEDKSIQLDMNSGNANHLVNKLFLYCKNQLVMPGFGAELYLTFNPQPWLLDLWNEEPEFFNEKRTKNNEL